MAHAANLTGRAHGERTTSVALGVLPFMPVTAGSASAFATISFTGIAFRLRRRISIAAVLPLFFAFVLRAIPYLLGRYSRLVLDSWTRPTYRKLAGARSELKDATIERRFKRYGEWAGLAFWLYLTRSWVEDGVPV
jgi:hypothetical protein